MAEYRFVTFWKIEAPQAQVFDVIADSLNWPDWWPGACRVEQLQPGNAEGLQCVRRYTWKSRLPYRLTFDALTIRVEPPTLLEARTSGDLEGTGRWRFSQANGVTTVRYEWNVRTTRRWMNLLAPIARPLFASNHHSLMQAGADGLARRLGARLTGTGHRKLRAGNGKTAFDPIAAAWAGIAAGILASGLQLLLWLALSYPLPDILWRDIRLTAAIVMGPAVIASGEPGWTVMLAASAIHFSVSITCGLAMAPLLGALGRRAALGAGAGGGLLIYLVNMHGFTMLFPWFAVARDWVTLAAHVGFGISVAACYRLWRDRA